MYHIKVVIIITLIYSAICYKAFQHKFYSTRRSNSIIQKYIVFEYKYPSSNRFYSRITVLQSSNNLDNSELHIDLEKMKLVDLKVLLKKLGKSPNNLRKSELIIECRRYMSNITDSSRNLINPLVNDNSSSLYSSTGSVNTSTRDIPSSNYDNKQYANTTMNQDRNQSNSNIKLKTRINLPPISPGSNAFSYTGNSVNITDGKFMMDSSNTKKKTGSVGSTINNNNYHNDSNEVGSSRFPNESREKRLLEDSGNSELDLIFLGTASCMPTITRGVSCLAMRYGSDVWLFDCGESSQVQLQRSKIRPSRISKIFITHTHGDHSFGLPGVLCLIGQARSSEDYHMQSGYSHGDTDYINEPIDIYGPEGIRDLIRGVVQMSYSKIVVPHRIHELKDVPFLHDKFVKPPSPPVIRTRLDSAYGERGGGRDIYPNENGCYEIFQDETFKVVAAPMQHTVPCVGYVVKEMDRPGALRIDSLLPIVEANKVALSKKMPMYLKVLARLKELKNGDSYTFPDGTVVRPESYLDPPKQGRKIVIMGDTCSSERMVPFAMDADVLVHEATNAHLAEEEDKVSRHSNYIALERETFQHGHSTPQMAGRFAKQIRTKRLLLTHFSPRYCGDDSYYSLKIMSMIEDQAREASGLIYRKNDVIAAWDQMQINVKTPKEITK